MDFGCLLVSNTDKTGRGKCLLKQAAVKAEMENILVVTVKIAVFQVQVRNAYMAARSQDSEKLFQERRNISHMVQCHCLCYQVITALYRVHAGRVNVVCGDIANLTVLGFSRENVQHCSGTIGARDMTRLGRQLKRQESRAAAKIEYLQ